QPPKLLGQYLTATGLSNDAGALALAQQVADADERSKSQLKPQCPDVVLRKAAALCTEKEAKLAKATKALIAAEKWLEDWKGRQAQAAEELFEADQSRIEAQEATLAKSGDQVGTSPESECVPFGIDMALFENLEEYEEEGRKKLEEIQVQLQQVAEQAKARGAEFKEVLAATKKAFAAPRKKRRAEGGSKEDEAADMGEADAPAPGQGGPSSSAAGDKGPKGGKGPTKSCKLSPEERARMVEFIQDAKVFFCNITGKGPQARRYLTEKVYKHSAAALVETHQGSA
ncbi:unnamed protein product, partial [Prorocentrum cordatum]